jgi:hypothetical protein
MYKGALKKADKEDIEKNKIDCFSKRKYLLEESRYEIELND